MTSGYKNKKKIQAEYRELNVRSNNSNSLSRVAISGHLSPVWDFPFLVYSFFFPVGRI